MLAPFIEATRRQFCCVLTSQAQCLNSIKAGEEIIDCASPEPPASVAAASSFGPELGRSPLRGALPVGPRERGVPTYDTAAAEVEALQGEPVRSGQILLLRLGESVQEKTLSLYAHGFQLAPSDLHLQERQSRRPVLQLWSPFSLVEKCQVKTIQNSTYWAVFKLTIFRQEAFDQSFYFANTGVDAYAERDQWVKDMASAISRVTASLFPRHAITVQPIPGKEATTTRIMAGYLFTFGVQDKASLFYFELHAYSGGKAQLVQYKDEGCDEVVATIPLLPSSTVSARKGAYCATFGVDTHRFCARTRDEKDLWLRAVSNIKIKLLYDAPEPDAGDLAIFRAAVRERVESLGDPAGNAQDGSADPLLAELPRRPPSGPQGDAWDPELVDDPEARDASCSELPEAAPVFSGTGALVSTDEKASEGAFPAASAAGFEVLELQDCRCVLGSAGSPRIALDSSSSLTAPEASAPAARGVPQSRTPQAPEAAAGGQGREDSARVAEEEPDRPGGLLQQPDPDGGPAAAQGQCHQSPLDSKASGPSGDFPLSPRGSSPGPFRGPPLPSPRQRLL